MRNQSLRILLATTAVFAGVDAQAQSPYNLISGNVWKEQGTINNLKDAGEQGVAGIMISLLDVNSGATVANALSDSTGAYTLSNYAGTGDFAIQFDYPVAGYNLVQQRVGSNNAINSSADPTTAQTDMFTISSPSPISNYNLGVSAKTNTITYSRVKLSELTDWSHSFLLPKSDSMYGVLTKATIYVNNTEWHPYFGVENTSGSAVTTSPSSGIQVTITPPVGAAINVSNSIPHINTPLAAHDGTTDYGGVSGKTWSNEFASVVATPRVVSLAAQLNPFRGTGTVSFPTTALGTVTLAGGGNLLSQISTRLGASVSIVYEYAGGILPVSLTAFKAVAKGNEVTLEWTTETETNNNRFEIERSIDGNKYQTVATVNTKARQGNSVAKLDYSFVDRNVQAGKIYYRLKQVDNDGESNYSYIRSVIIGGKAGASVYPNPADRMVNLNTSEPGLIEIFDIKGKPVSKFDKKNAGVLPIEVSSYPTGSYVIKFVANGTVQTQQFIVVH